VAVGLGQAGGNLAAEFFRRGYRALALNTAETDLQALDPGGAFPAMPAERRLYVGLDGYDGAGADPAYGRDCVREHADRIRAAVLKQAHDADAVILTAGLGGGTGSAIPELVDVLAEEELPLMALMTLPTESESGLAKVNAVRAINDIVDAPLLGWIFADNARISKLNRDIAIADYFAHVNSQIIAPIDEFNRLNARDSIRAIRSFDGEDFRKLLLSGGVLNYAFSDIPRITTEEIAGTVRDCIEASDIMPGGFEMARVSFIGLVIEASEAALAEASIQVFEDIHETIKQETEGAAVYQGIYKVPDDRPITIRLIAATQSLPHRIRQILADAKREGGVITDKLREELPTLELGELEGIDLFKRSSRPSQKPRRNRAQLGAAKGLRGHAGGGPEEVASEVGANSPLRSRRVNRRGGRPAPARAPSAAEPPRPEKRPNKPPKEIGTEEIDVVAALAELSDMPDEAVESELQETVAAAELEMPVNGQELPSPEQYDELVAQYLNAENAKARQTVVQRLESDSVADDTIVRYYAVEAMSKLGRKVFGNALLAATEDDDEAVRNLAVEALKG
jgi:cell division GTPase FtsZ